MLSDVLRRADPSQGNPGGELGFPVTEPEQARPATARMQAGDAAAQRELFIVALNVQ